jgi:hypothetical protein
MQLLRQLVIPVGQHLKQRVSMAQHSQHSVQATMATPTQTGKRGLTK